MSEHFKKPPGHGDIGPLIDWRYDNVPGLYEFDIDGVQVRYDKDGTPSYKRIIEYTMIDGSRNDNIYMTSIWNRISKEDHNARRDFLKLLYETLAIDVELVCWTPELDWFMVRNLFDGSYWRTMSRNRYSDWLNFT